MPKEVFFHPDANTDDDPRKVFVTFGENQPGVEINGVPVDRTAVNRFIRVLRNARDRTYGRDE